MQIFTPYLSLTFLSAEFFVNQWNGKQNHTRKKITLVIISENLDLSSFWLFFYIIF